jgi:ABC-type phosphate/phosphonate transport system permease subunit
VSAARLGPCRAAHDSTREGNTLDEAILGLGGSRVGTILLIVLAVVVASEAGSAWLRRRLT